jgi:hypothetical protein
VCRTLKSAGFLYLESWGLNQDSVETHLVLFVCTVVQTITQLWDSL